jgi:hypothetical protein
MDWTDFDPDDQSTIMLSLVSNHGRSTPLVWLTVDKATLKNHRFDSSSTSIPRFDNSRSTCLMACLGSRPRPNASPCPIVFTAREALLMTPSVAFANE